MTLRVGIIGCGRISARHFQVLAEIPEVQIQAVCDRIPDRLEAARQRTGAAGYPDFREMVERETLDLAVVLTESGSHAEIGMAVAPHVKALVIEKPMALTLVDADRLIETCERSGTSLFVVKQNRYNPPVIQVRKALDEGRFGKLVLGTVRVRWCRSQDYYRQDAWRGTWRWDGGVLTNQASHHIDLLQWMMGPIESVKAYTATRLADIETEDTGAAILRFQSGALGIIEATTGTRPKDLEGSLSILGEKGSAVIGGFAVNQMQTWQFVEEQEGDAAIRGLGTQSLTVYGQGHAAFYRDVLDCLATGRRPMLDGLEGRKSLELICAIYESAASDKEVALRYTPHNVPLGR